MTPTRPASTAATAERSVEPLLTVRGLAVSYGLPRRGFGRRPQLRAVVDMSFDVASGETLGLVGESGSGKTTVGRSILGLARPQAGSIVFDGVQLVGADAATRRRLSSQIQVVFQNPYTSLNPALTIGDAIGEPLQIHRGLSGANLEAAVAGLLRRVGLDPDAARRLPRAFSGGQRQRIAIARAIAVEPRFVIYDEAVSALDVSTRSQIINLMDELRHQLGLASLFIGHDLAVVRHVSDRIAVMFRGHLVEIGPATAVADHPRHPYTRRLVSSILVADPVKQARWRQPVRRIGPGDPSPTGCPYLHACPDRLDVCAVEAPSLRQTESSITACHLYPAGDRDTAVVLQRPASIT